eukprot:766727-Hanusia_phi.AAC.6
MLSLNGSKGSVRNDIKQSTSTNAVLQNAVGGAEVSCQVYDVDGFLQELNVQSRLVSRDMNAALNTLACFVNAERAEYLRRPKG